MLVVTARTPGMSPSPLGKRLFDLTTLGWGCGEPDLTATVTVLPANSPDAHRLTGAGTKAVIKRPVYHSLSCFPASLRETNKTSLVVQQDFPSCQPGGFTAF